MGMFDNINVKYPLPLPLEVIDSIPDIYDLEFQTKSMDNAMEEYILEENGKLLKEEKTYEWKDDDSSFLKGYYDVIDSEIVETNFHGVVNFYFYERLYNDNTKKTGIDVNVEYSAKFSEGNLDSINVIEYNITDATEQIKSLNEFFLKAEQRKKLWYNKYLFNTRIVLFLRKIVKRFVYQLHRATDKLYTLSIRYL